MKEKVRVLVTGKLVSALIGADFNFEIITNELEDIGTHPICDDVIEPKKCNFIQQKMQGKRRGY